MFPVLQGTRQGGLYTLPTLYLIYINDLISEIEQSGAWAVIVLVPSVLLTT